MTGFTCSGYAFSFDPEHKQVHDVHGLIRQIHYNFNHKSEIENKNPEPQNKGNSGKHRQNKNHYTQSMGRD